MPLGADRQRSWRRRVAVVRAVTRLLEADYDCLVVMRARSGQRRVHAAASDDFSAALTGADATLRAALDRVTGRTMSAAQWRRALENVQAPAHDDDDVERRPAMLPAVRGAREPAEEARRAILRQMRSLAQVRPPSSRPR